MNCWCNFGLEIRSVERGICHIADILEFYFRFRFWHSGRNRRVTEHHRANYYLIRRHLEFFQKCNFGPPVTIAWQCLAAYQIWCSKLHWRPRDGLKSESNMAAASILNFQKVLFAVPMQWLLRGQCLPMDQIWRKYLYWRPTHGQKHKIQDDRLRHLKFYQRFYSGAKASVPGASNKLAEWVNEWVIEYAIFLHGLAQQRRPRQKRNSA